jgi:hypothetical protein
MLIKIIDQNSPRPENGVSTDKIEKLVSNYYDRMKKKKGTWSRQLDTTEDTRSAWFSKERLDALFQANRCTHENSSLYGIRIYYGVHKQGILVDNNGNELIKDERYFNQQTVILVVTRRDCKKCAGQDCNKCPDEVCKHKCPNRDCLKKDNYVEIAGDFRTQTIGADEGMDYGKLCPPETCDGSVITF